MTNEEKYRTLDERQSAFQEYCSRYSCPSCKHFNNRNNNRNCALAWLADEVEEGQSVSSGSERTRCMETTRFVVKYNFPVTPTSRLMTPVISMIMDAFPLFMEVDATCARDAVEAVLAARPNASIVAVRAQKTDYEKKDEV